MEEIILNIDSKYRDIIKYPNECKFRINLEKTYKNIVSIRMTSLEINNSINYISSQKNNNFIKVHLPNKANDPHGTVIQLYDGLLQLIGSIRKIFNGILSEVFNSNRALQTQYIDNAIFAEKYFYIFYLNENVTFTFDFNDGQTQPASLTNKLTIQKGWHSIYGIVYNIQQYIIIKQSERAVFVSKNPGVGISSFDSGNFSLSSTTLKIFDRRLRHTSPSKDCVREDQIIAQTFNTNNFEQNLNNLKTHIYKTYIKDITNFITESIPDTGIASTTGFGILDLLATNEFLVPNGYINQGKLLSKSKYYVNDYPGSPTSDNIQLYNLSMEVDLTALRVYFSNTFTNVTTGNTKFFYYYWVDYFTGTPATWEKIAGNSSINLIENLLDKNFLYQQRFISLSEFNNPNYQGTLEKDIPPFEIDFNTSANLTNHVVDGLPNINKIDYPSVGSYMGFRPDMKKSTNKFLLSSIADSTDMVIRADKIFNTAGDNYIFIKINDVGYIDFFNQKLFAKILLTSGLGNPKLDAYVNQGYRYRQPVNINRLDLELVDYLGNTLDLNGFDWSCTLELKQVVSSEQKDQIEKQSIMFNY